MVHPKLIGNGGGAAARGDDRGFAAALAMSAMLL
jgi:hypothetical protein